ncbi:hypothetical protein ARMSODRAFT_979784 [Armillaria solidipes]|uniref:Uncharacterized protein n=1 Tax=Armillaria solidipes TaxID=1076256 RepID=A0A2H3B1Q0_9AGAR|nr:hypothetical protein ARMSODRAFT_979784 [Armillaria solidipes]
MTPPPVALSRPDDPTLRKAPLLLHAMGRDLVPPKSQFKVPAMPAKTEEEPSQVEPEVGPSVERKNKDAVRGIVVRSIPTHPLPKRHPEYKEAFNWIYRGVLFFMLELHLNFIPSVPI